MKKIAIILAISATFAACNNSSNPGPQEKALALKQLKDSIQLDSFKRAETAKQELVKEQEKAAALKASSNSSVSRSSSGSSSSSGQRSYVKGVSETYSNPEPAKKGWSKAAKGAAIGAGVGAITGVAVSKKDGKGAVIGGLAGAGAGYVIGRSQDKKDGRVQ